MFYKLLSLVLGAYLSPLGAVGHKLQRRKNLQTQYFPGNFMAFSGSFSLLFLNILSNIYFYVCITFLIYYQYFPSTSLVLCLYFPRNFSVLPSKFLVLLHMLAFFCILLNTFVRNLIFCTPWFTFANFLSTFALCHVSLLPTLPLQLL